MESANKLTIKLQSKSKTKRLRDQPHSYEALKTLVEA